MGEKSAEGSLGTADFDGMYTGCDYDSATGLTYHWNRWRSEDGSCFIREDPARDGANWWGYCGGNPITFVDPDGLFYYKKIIKKYIKKQLFFLLEIMDGVPNPESVVLKIYSLNNMR